MIVADEDQLLQRPNVFFQEVQPLLLVLNLIHVNIASGHVFVTTRQAWILARKSIAICNIDLSSHNRINRTYLIRPVGPLSIRFDDSYEFLGEPETTYGKPVDVGARLRSKSLVKVVERVI